MSVKSLFSESAPLLLPVVSPYRAYDIASKIMVFPDPVSPVTRNRPWSISSNSMTVFSS